MLFDNYERYKTDTDHHIIKKQSNKKEKNKIEKIEDCQMKQNKMHNKPEAKICQEQR